MSAGAPKAALPRAPRESPPMTDLIWRWRDRIVSSPFCQKWAPRVPGISWVARKRASQLFDIGAGFVYAQTLFACVKLKLFDIVADGPLPAAEIARRSGLRPEAAERLASAAIALNLLQRRGKGADGEPLIGLGVLGASILGNPGYVDIVRHHEMFYRDLADPVALLKGEAPPTELSRFWPYAADPATRGALSTGDIAAYTNLMAASQGFVSGDLRLQPAPLGDGRRRRRRHVPPGGGRETPRPQASALRPAAGRRDRHGAFRRRRNGGPRKLFWRRLPA
jgi:demethylspheroidene O-methyltransferase